MKCLNVCAAFLNPKGILTISNNLKGVVRAVFGTSSGATGIWWYAHTRSSMVKMVASSSEEESCMCGTG